jgi:Rrf2 family transcriptional regulator, nitric oxide-sensitive transcriptional repressor
MSNLVRISEAASLAIHTMALLARQRDEHLTNEVIAQRLGASGHHLAKVMQRLVRAHLVESLRGPFGGFRLGVSPGEIGLLQIYEAVEGPIGDAGGACPLGRPACRDKNCMLGSLMCRLHQQACDYLARTTVQDLSTELVCLKEG